LWHDCFHVAKFLLEGVQHLLANLKLDSSWVMLDRQSVLAQVLDEQLILHFIIALTHL